MAHVRRRHAYQAPSWLGLLIWTAIFMAIFWLGASAPVYPASDRVDATRRPTCTTGKPMEIWLLNESNATDCDAIAGGSTPALCCCDGDATPAWAPCASAGTAGNSFETWNLPSGTDPVADSATDTMTVTCAAPLTCTGDSATDTWAFAWSVTVGTVTSVALAMPSEFSVSGSPITTSGTFTVTEATQTANTVYAGPTSGGAAAPGFRGVVDADVPDTITISNATNTRPYSIHNSPASPGTYDCEFNSGLCSGYAFSVDAGTSTPASGTVSPLASVTPDPIYDTTTWPGWLLVQSDESSGQGIYIKKTATIGTNATLYGRVLSDNNNISSVGEGATCIKLYNSEDSNENISACVNKGTSATNLYCDVNNNGTITSISSPGTTLGEEVPITFDTLVIWKATNAYYCGVFGLDGAWSGVLAIGTKTGVTTFDQIATVIATANETPSMIFGFDYLRLIDSAVFPPLNP